MRWAPLTAGSGTDKLPIANNVAQPGQATVGTPPVHDYAGLNTPSVSRST
ncbi:MAG: hypothetical protein Q8M01_12525 [Rubrivivax sp.]|nr:hypothetical protein [Rubrivivax sp.]